MCKNGRNASLLIHSFVNKYEIIFSFLVRPTSLTPSALQTDEDPKEIDFFTKQARLQIEARMALAQAKDMAHMQMEVSENGMRCAWNR